MPYEKHIMRMHTVPGTHLDVLTFRATLCVSSCSRAAQQFSHIKFGSNSNFVHLYKFILMSNPKFFNVLGNYLTNYVLKLDTLNS